MPVSTIQFYNADHPFVLRQKNIVRQWMTKVCKQHGKKIDQITFVFCSDDYLLQINQQFLQHDYYTDIITFDSSSKEAIAIEAYISIDRVRENATQVKVAMSTELHRVLIHGVLHSLGYKDKSTRDQTQMRIQEEQSLKILQKMLN